MLEALQVIWIDDAFTRPPKPKMVVCVCPDEGYFFRINSEGRWAGSVPLRLRDCGAFLRHDSFLECGTLLEFSEYVIGESMERGGVPGRVPAFYAAAIWAAVERSPKINPRDKLLIRRALPG